MLGLILLLGVISYGLLFFSFKFVALYSTKIAKKIIDKMHQDAEDIMESGLVPKHWIKEKWESIRRMMPPGAEKRAALRKIEKLIKFYSRTSLVQDENTRKEIVGKLQSQKNYWKEAEWNEIFPYETDNIS